MSVKKIIEISSVSNESFSDAVSQGLKRTAKTVKNISCAEIVKQYVCMENEEIIHFHVDMKVRFEVND